MIKAWNTFIIKQFHCPDNCKLLNGIKMPIKSRTVIILGVATLWDMESEN